MDQGGFNKTCFGTVLDAEELQVIWCWASFSANPSVRSGTAKEDPEAVSLGRLIRSGGCQPKITLTATLAALSLLRSQGTSSCPQNLWPPTPPPCSLLLTDPSSFSYMQTFVNMPIHINEFHKFIIVAHVRHLSTHILENNVSLNIEGC